MEIKETNMTPSELSRIITANDFTKDDVALICGVSIKSLYSWLNGQHPIPRSVAILLTAYDAGYIDLTWMVDFVEQEMNTDLAVM